MDSSLTVFTIMSLRLIGVQCNGMAMLRRILSVDPFLDRCNGPGRSTQQTRVVARRVTRDRTLFTAGRRLPIAYDKGRYHSLNRRVAMPLQPEDFRTLHRYAEGVMARIGHHAGNVGGIALALLGAIIWRGEPGSIEIMQRAGNLTNVLWVRINGTRYAFWYNHEDQAIEMRMRSTQGAVLHCFSNATPIENVETVFRKL